MNRLEAAITIILAIIIIATSMYVISVVPWFDLNPDPYPCPEGTRPVVTVWNEGTPTERTDWMCVQGEE